jgi:hypothetical protein
MQAVSICATDRQMCAPCPGTTSVDLPVLSPQAASNTETNPRANRNLQSFMVLTFLQFQADPNCRSVVAANVIVSAFENSAAPR